MSKIKNFVSIKKTSMCLPVIFLPIKFFYLLSQILKFDPLIKINKSKIKNILSPPHENDPPCIIMSKIKINIKLFEPKFGIIIAPYFLFKFISCNNYFILDKNNCAWLKIIFYFTFC